MVNEDVLEEEKVVDTATAGFLDAAKALGLTGGSLARAVGVSEPTISRMRRGGTALVKGSKPHELAALMVRVHQALGKIFCGDQQAIREWMTSSQPELKGVPLERIGDVCGLVSILAYSEMRARRS